MFFGKSAAWSTGSLITGSVFASLINIAMLPVIARAFGPTTLGIGAIFIAIHSFLVILATGRYSLAIPLPKRDTTAQHLVLLVAVLSIGFGIMTGVAGRVFGESIGTILSMPQISIWLPWLGLMTAVAGIYEAVNYWLVRCNRFHTKSIFNVTHTLFFLGCLLTAAFVGQATIISYMQALVTGMTGAGLVLSVWVISKMPKLRFRRSHMFRAATYYRHLPKHLLTTSVLNHASTISLPIVLAIFSGPVAVATYALVAQVIGRPFNLISSSIWQVVFGSLSNAQNDTDSKTGELEAIYNFTSLFYCMPLIACVALADKAVLLLGENWSDIGPVIGLYLIMAYFQFSSNSISYFQSFGRYFAESVVNTILIGTRFGAIICAGLLELDAYHTILVFCVSSAFVYLCITTYWSRVFGFGLRLPLRGLMLFFISYFVAIMAKKYLDSWILYGFLIGILTVISIACLSYYRSRSRANA